MRRRDRNGDRLRGLGRLLGLGLLDNCLSRLRLRRRLFRSRLGSWLGRLGWLRHLHRLVESCFDHSGQFQSSHHNYENDHTQSESVRRAVLLVDQGQRREYDCEQQSQQAQIGYGMTVAVARQVSKSVHFPLLLKPCFPSALPIE